MSFSLSRSLFDWDRRVVKANAKARKIGQAGRWRRQRPFAISSLVAWHSIIDVRGITLCVCMFFYACTSARADAVRAGRWAYGDELLWPSPCRPLPNYWRKRERSNYDSGDSEHLDNGRQHYKVTVPPTSAKGKSNRHYQRESKRKKGN